MAKRIYKNNTPTTAAPVLDKYIPTYEKYPPDWTMPVVRAGEQYKKYEKVRIYLLDIPVVRAGEHYEQ